MAADSLWKKHFLLCLLGALALWQGVECLKHSKPPLLPRIVGGSFAKLGQFPYQVALLYNNEHLCGGSIISKEYIITAAHCVVYQYTKTRLPVTSLSIRAGSLSPIFGGQQVGVANITINPAYDWFHHDIAVLKLSEPLEFNENVQAIALANADPPSGVQVSTSGWGRTSTYGPFATLLKNHTLTSLTRDDCEKESKRFVPKSVICLMGGDNNGICKGDSGGPAVYNNTLVGVVNYYNKGCGVEPEGFASIKQNRGWIRDNSGGI
ncbi:serine protease SP24D [Stomoxys calcitrans]|uniref:Peptidase S1 domain-containing protein n=1 Tax=Stomoxys calcitrans TaxID=35570 RepID=A0A1I8PAG6_STOCA|nr:serine protease SP24D [Stomoxys calcitrans]